MGVVPPAPLPTYPDGFPPDVVATLERGDRPALLRQPARPAGPRSIEQCGEHHLQTGEVILYTSAGLGAAARRPRRRAAARPSCYAACAAARAAMTGEHAVGRVIARPVRGRRRAPSGAPRGARTSRSRRPARSYLEELQSAGVPVHAVGKVARPVRRRGHRRVRTRAPTNERGDRGHRRAACDELDAGSSSPTWSRPTRSTATATTSRASTRALREIDAAVGEWLGAPARRRPAGAHRRPRRRPARAAHRPHARVRAAAGHLRRPGRPPPRRPAGRRRRVACCAGSRAARRRAAARRLPALRTLTRARAPRGRDDPPPARAPRRGAASSSAWRSPTRAGACRWRPRRSSTRVAGPARASGWAGAASTCVGARGRRLPAHAPAHDRARCSTTRRRARRTSACAGSSTTATSCASATRGASGPASWRSATAARDAFFAARLGLEPLDGELTGERAAAAGARAPRARSRRSCSTSGGSRASGNIYADEALFRARIHPLRAAGQPHARAVRRAGATTVREALPAGLDAGRRDDRRLPPRRRRPAAPSRTSSSSTCAAGEPCPRCGDAGGQVRRGRARDLRVRALPAAPAAPAR